MISEYIHRWATKQYFSPAIHHRETTIHYGELSAAITDAKEALVCHGVSEGSRVIVNLDKSPALLVLVYALLDIGACYIPIGRKSKASLVAAVRDSANADFRIFMGEHHTVHLELAVLNESLQLESFETPSRNIQSTSGGTSLAAILFTSGSTGHPKGVMLSVHSVNQFLKWASHYFNVQDDDCFASHAELHFDISFFDIYLPFIHGASVVLFDTVYQKNPLRMIADIKEKKVTMWQSVPSVLSLLRVSVEQNFTDPLAGVRTVFFSGEVMPMHTLSFTKRFFPNAKIVHGYGCTETNDTFVYEVDRNTSYQTLPIGRPTNYTSFVVLDKNGLECSSGQVGELMVAGATLLLGYTDSQLDRTSIIWRKDCFGRTTRYYKTGDLVRSDGNDDYYFISRVDAVVKIRGNRVNLAEVESCIGEMPNVESCVVIPVETIDATLISVAIVQEVQSLGLRSVAIRMFLSKRIPANHIPQKIYIRSKPFVLNKNGKIDRKAVSAAYCREINNNVELLE